MADDNETMTVEVRFWPKDMSLVGQTVTWPREQAMQAIQDHRAVRVDAPPVTSETPPPTRDDTEPAPATVEAEEPHRRRKTADKPQQ